MVVKPPAALFPALLLEVVDERHEEVYDALDVLARDVLCTHRPQEVVLGLLNVGEPRADFLRAGLNEVSLCVL